jgi:hypothetical protein
MACQQTWVPVKGTSQMGGEDGNLESSTIAVTQKPCGQIRVSCGMPRRSKRHIRPHATGPEVAQ